MMESQSNADDRIYVQVNNLIEEQLPTEPKPQSISIIDNIESNSSMNSNLNPLLIIAENIVEKKRPDSKIEDKFKIPATKNDSTNSTSQKKIDVDIEIQNHPLMLQQRRKQAERAAAQQKNFEWISYEYDPQISSDSSSNTVCNYLQDFLKTSQEFDYAGLDLNEHEQVNEIKLSHNVGDQAFDIERRLLVYGQVDRMSQIAQRSGAYNKEIAVESRDNNYYDTTDPFLDDGEEIIDNQVNSGQMRLAEANICHYHIFQGGLQDLINSVQYKERIQSLKQFEQQDNGEEEVKPMRSKNDQRRIKQPPTITIQGDQGNAPKPQKQVKSNKESASPTSIVSDKTQNAVYGTNQANPNSINNNINTNTVGTQFQFIHMQNYPQALIQSPYQNPQANIGANFNPNFNNYVNNPNFQGSQKGQNYIGTGGANNQNALNLMGYQYMQNDMHQHGNQGNQYYHYMNPGNQEGYFTGGGNFYGNMPQMPPSGSTGGPSMYTNLDEFKMNSIFSNNNNSSSGIKQKQKQPESTQNGESNTNSNANAVVILKQKVKTQQNLEIIIDNSQKDSDIKIKIPPASETFSNQCVQAIDIKPQTQNPQLNTNLQTVIQIED